LGKLDDARKTVAQMSKLFPLDANLAYEAGEFLLQYNLTDEAQTDFQRASDLLSRRGNDLPSEDLSLSDVELQIARLQFDRSDYWSALQYFNKIQVEQVPTILQPSALHLEGQALVAVGRAQEALARLREAARMNPYNPEFLVHLAWADVLAGHLKSADSVMQLAANKWPDVPDVKLVLTLVKHEDLLHGEQVPYSQEWHLKGKGLVCRPCKMPRPCRSNAPPSYGHCENAAFTHIVQGHYDRISLSGLSFVTGVRKYESASSFLRVLHKPVSHT
jgi:tetratricopeptide (TPR) repeat protein